MASPADEAMEPSEVAEAGDLSAMEASMAQAEAPLSSDALSRSDLRIFMKI